MFNLEAFINEYVIHRDKSMFADDIERNKDTLFKIIKGKTVLVIGGAGSIGSEFIKSILPYEPISLIVVDINENGLAELTRDLRSTKGIKIPEEYIPYPISYSSNVFKKIFLGHRGFDIVANFSAHKHVRSEKDIYSIEALMENNVLQAQMLLDLLSIFPPEMYFCVSTDKAANPVNIMGASKRIMEDLIFSYSDLFPVKTARFANVAFSNGSLPAGFLARLQKKQPLTGPSDIKRYFVSGEESGQICLLACALGNNREIFFPKLQESQMMSFEEIGKHLLEAQDYIPLECKSDKEAIDRTENVKNGGKLYPVYFSISDTSGEKKYEEFYTGNEIIDLTRFSSLGVITEIKKPNRKAILDLLNTLRELFEKGTDKGRIVSVLENYLSDFHHIETEKSLDSKM